MENEEEPNTTMARTLFEFAKKNFLVGEELYRLTWDELGIGQTVWQRMAAQSHEAYHAAYEAREQTMPAITGKHRGGLYQDGDGNFYSPEAERAFRQQHQA